MALLFSAYCKQQANRPAATIYSFFASPMFVFSLAAWKERPPSSQSNKKITRIANLCMKIVSPTHSKEARKQNVKKHAKMLSFWKSLMRLYGVLCKRSTIRHERSDFYAFGFQIHEKLQSKKTPKSRKKQRIFRLKTSAYFDEIKYMFSQKHIDAWIFVSKHAR
ncbi:MAG: hypothetical protein PUG76_08065 [Prevotellaceae bacterium]|nr:hypothetical protein [Prevotellaceae bacterium]